MSNDPSALPEIGTGPSGEADYDAAQAAFVATESGRRFLTEYRARNRPVEPPAPAAPVAPRVSRRRDLAELASAINRIKAEIATSDAQPPNGLTAAERLQDIAFAIRESDVEATLCDALDKAIREISVACALNDATAERTRNAAHRVRDLASRITDTIELWLASDRGEPSAGETAAASPVNRAPIEGVAGAQFGGASGEAPPVACEAVLMRPSPTESPPSGPEDDPADLFEPSPPPSPLAAQAPTASVSLKAPASPEPLAPPESEVLPVPATVAEEGEAHPLKGASETSDRSDRSENSSAPLNNNEADRSSAAEAAAKRPSQPASADLEPGGEAMSPSAPRRGKHRGVRSEASGPPGAQRSARSIARLERGRAFGVVQLAVRRYPSRTVHEYRLLALS